MKQFVNFVKSIFSLDGLDFCNSKKYHILKTKVGDPKYIPQEVGRSHYASYKAAKKDIEQFIALCANYKYYKDLNGEHWALTMRNGDVYTYSITSYKKNTIY